MGALAKTSRTHTMSVARWKRRNHTHTQMRVVAVALAALVLVTPFVDAVRIRTSANMDADEASLPNIEHVVVLVMEVCDMPAVHILLRDVAVRLCAAACLRVAAASRPHCTALYYSIDVVVPLPCCGQPLLLDLEAA